LFDTVESGGRAALSGDQWAKNETTVRRISVLAALSEAFPDPAGEASLLDGRDDGVDVVAHAAHLDTAVVEVDHRVGGVGIAIARLADTARVEDDPFVEHRVMLNVRVTQNQQFLLSQESGREIPGVGVSVGILRVAVDEFHAIVDDAALGRERSEPLDRVRAELAAGVVDAGLGHAVETGGVAARDRAVVVAQNGGNAALTDRVDALGGPGVVADHVPGTDERVDRGHVREHRFQRGAIGVNVGDDAEAHVRRKRREREKRDYSPL